MCTVVSGISMHVDGCITGLYDVFNFMVYYFLGHSTCQGPPSVFDESSHVVFNSAGSLMYSLIPRPLPMLHAE